MKISGWVLMLTGLIFPMSVWAACPADKPVQWFNGECLACDQVKGRMEELPQSAKGDEAMQIMVVLKSAEETCPELKNKGKAKSSAAAPVQKKAVPTVPVVSRSLVGRTAAVCPPDKPLLDKNLHCRSCLDYEVLKLKDKGDCEKLCKTKDGKSVRKTDFFGCKLVACPKGERFVESCVVKAPCPSDMPLEDHSGFCHACDEVQNIVLKNKSECNTVCKAPNGQPLRHGTFWGCVLRQCPKDAPYRDPFDRCYTRPICPKNAPLIGKDGKCYPCNMPAELIVLAGTCETSCKNRESSYTENYLENCYLKSKGQTKRTNKKTNSKGKHNSGIRK